MKRNLGLLLALCAVFVFAACAPARLPAASAPSAEPSWSPAPSYAPLPEIELTVAAAASLTDVTKALADDYAKVAPHIKLTFTYASSGALQTQIEQGAPVDLFLSAAQKQMNALEEKNLINKDTRVNLLENKLVLIVSKDSKAGIASFEDVATDKAGQVAIGDPASVPAGQYAQKAFESLKLWEQVKAKANLGTDVRQVLTWVESGNAECGLVYSTDAATSRKITVICEAPEGSVEKIIYPAAVTAESKHTEEAKAFLDYLAGDSAAAVFKEYGFSIA